MLWQQAGCPPTRPPSESTHPLSPGNKGRHQLRPLAEKWLAGCLPALHPCPVRVQAQFSCRPPRSTSPSVWLAGRAGAKLSLGCMGCVGEELHWPHREGDSQGPRPLSPIIPVRKACGGPGILTTAEPYADTPLQRAGSGLRWPRAENELTTPSL